ncbi:hypothetical protein CZ794_01385 [Psychrobacter sp. JB385]|nr:hypothetical protein CZ794_01385 [Psychrobacter sp. JB385]
MALFFPQNKTDFNQTSIGAQTTSACHPMPNTILLFKNQADFGWLK